MESSLTKPLPVKRRLGELLQEQQEPFCLDVYLVERGYLKKTLDLKPASSHRRKTTPLSPKILKTILKKLLPTKDALKTASTGKAGYAEEEPVRFSSASSMTVYDSYSESDMEEDFPSHPQNHEQVTGCGCFLGDSKQHSPVSVLEYLHSSDQASSFCKHMRCCPRPSNENEIPSALTNRVTEEALLSASLWDLLQHSNQGNASSSEYRKTKRAVEETKQLLFDSVREIQGSKLLGGEQVGKMICQQICFWSEQSAGNLTNITQLLNSDLLEAEKWNDTHPQTTKEIEEQISNAILEELEFEIVSDLIHSVT